MKDKSINYSPTDSSINPPITIDKTTIQEKEKTENEYDINNNILTKTSVLIDEKNIINTELFLKTTETSKNNFRYSERHSIGKKFISNKLI